MKNGVKEAVQEMKETIEAWRRGYERYCSHLYGMGGKVLFRCDVLCKWAGILEEGTVCLPVVFF